MVFSRHHGVFNERLKAEYALEAGQMLCSLIPGFLKRLSASPPIETECRCRVISEGITLDII